MAQMSGVNSSFGDEVSDIGLSFDLISDRPEWHAQAACSDHPEVTWFPEGCESTVPALAVCGRCPVVMECRQWALAQGPSLAGIWGGLSGRQRVQLSRTTRRAVA